MSAHPHGRGPRPDAVDPLRKEYDATKSLLSLCLTFVVAAVIFGGFICSLRAVPMCRPDLR